MIRLASISLGPGYTHWGKKEKKIGEQSEPRGNLGRGKGGGAWRHAFDASDPPSSN